jgi:hypothetical protein
MRRVLAAATAVIAVAALAAGTAAASNPVVVEKHNTLTRDFTNIPDCLAFGFTHSEHYDVIRTVTDFYDQEGNLLREVVHVRFIGTATNDVTGKTIPVVGVRHLIFDFVNETFTETGVLRHVTVPGQGIVLHDSGRLIAPFDETLPPLFVAGKHQLLEGDLNAFCTALAGT